MGGQLASAIAHAKHVHRPPARTPVFRVALQAGGVAAGHATSGHLVGDDQLV